MGFPISTFTLKCARIFGGLQISLSLAVDFSRGYSMLVAIRQDSFSSFQISFSILFFIFVFYSRSVSFVFSSFFVYFLHLWIVSFFSFFLIYFLHLWKFLSLFSFFSSELPLFQEQFLSNFLFFQAFFSTSILSLSYFFLSFIKVWLTLPQQKKP